MILSIILMKKSETTIPALKKTLQWANIQDYQILDPKHDDTNRSFPATLILGGRVNDSMPGQVWFLNAPYTLMDYKDKVKFAEKIKEIATWLIINKDPSKVKRADIPKTKDLKQYINSLTGRTIEVKLPDRRRIGIYPDGDELKQIYDREFHASEIINLAKLFDLFDATEIVIKEI